MSKRCALGAELSRRAGVAPARAELTELGGRGCVSPSERPHACGLGHSPATLAVPLAVLLWPGHAAAEEGVAPAQGQGFVDMPSEYLERKQQEELERRREAAIARGDVKEHAGYLPGYQRAPALSLSPHAPQRQPAMPGALLPAFGAPVRDHGWRFDFQGYLQAVLRASIGKRNNAVPGQKVTTLHGDPVVPGGSYGWFDHSLTVPTPWTQLNFLYGNDTVRATTIIGAWSVAGADEAAGYRIINAQVWFANAFLTYTPDVSPVGLKINVGAYPDRYGAMAQWHEGAYGASLIGSVYGVGTTATLELPFQGGIDGRIEGGFKGELDKAPVGIVQDSSNEYPWDEQGSTYAAHGHIGLSYKDLTPTFHIIHSWSQDDRADLPDYPSTPVNEAQQRKDGYVRIMGADFRWNAQRFGYLYFGGQRTTGKNANSITDLVRVLNSGSGKELNERYWGFDSRGNGDLTLLGGQYTLSLGRLLRHPVEFWGIGPDLTLSVFGIYGHVDSRQDAFDDKDMLKYGAEGVYSFSKYVAGSLRIDHVMPDLDNQQRSFAVFSPKLIARTNWVTRESLTLQYSSYALGDEVEVEGDNRLVNITSSNPDRHLVALYGTIWW